MMPGTPTAVSSARRLAPARVTAGRGGAQAHRWPGSLARLRTELEERWRMTLERVVALSLAYYDAAEHPRPGSATADQSLPDGPASASQLARQAVSERQRLAEIEAALDRISAGHYGSCEECGRPIAPGVLVAHPEARFCAACGRQAAVPRAT